MKSSPGSFPKPGGRMGWGSHGADPSLVLRRTSEVPHGARGGEGDAGGGEGAGVDGWIDGRGRVPFIYSSSTLLLSDSSSLAVKVAESAGGQPPGRELITGQLPSRPSPRPGDSWQLYSPVLPLDPRPYLLSAKFSHVSTV
ncbi:unnamed protein product [Lota lota]